MQVSVEVMSELSRNMKVVVPEERITQQVDSRLKSMSSKVKIDGFRPGKIPQAVLQRQYGKQVREEVIGELIQSSFQEGLRDQKLSPAGTPEIREVSFQEGEGLRFEAVFEVLPEFVLMPLETLEVTRFSSVVEEADIDRMLDRLRDQRKEWENAERASASGDRVIISFEGTHEGENFTQGKTESFPVVIGSGQMIPGFEDRLLGHSAGAHLEFDIDFPENYQGPKLAGKTAHFTIDIERVEAARLPVVDEAFAKSLGVESGDLKELRDDIRANMEREMSRALRNRTKASVMDQLFDKNPLQLPESLVQDELNDLIKPYRESARKQKQTLDEEALRGQLAPMSKRRVALALVLGKIIEGHALRVDPTRVRQAVEELAASYEDADEVIRWYYADPSRLQEIENMTLEDQIVDLILSKANARDESIDFQQLMSAA